MKFIFIGLFLALFAFTTLYAFSYYVSRPVSIEDINLEIAIRDTLDKHDGDITISHLHEIKNFEAVGANIRSLEGIQYMKNVRTLNLEDNFIEDVRPLKELADLQELNLRNNEIISLEAIHLDQLAELKNLKVLNLRHNVKRSSIDDQKYQHRLEDISLVSSLPSLETLILRDNHIKDPTPVADLTELIELDLSQNPIMHGDLSVLSSLTNLEELNLRETDVKDLTFLNEMQDLKYLNLHSNININSVDPISQLTDLETLIIANVPLPEDLEIIRDLDQLTRLNARNTGITDIRVLESLMEQGALQDDAGLSIEASIDISLNPIPLEKEGSDAGFSPIRDYWDNITVRSPETLLPPKTTTLFLNEYMASNSETYSDIEDNYYDWIELYNPSDDAINLAGYYLSDDPTNLTRYRLPDTMIEADSTLIVFASGQDYVDESGMIHTNFSLDRSGEPIILVEPDQTTVVDYFPPRDIPQDMSYGRSSDDVDEFFYFDEPTPGKTNSAVGSKSLLQVPSVSHDGGFYQLAFDLTFDVPESQTVYYTRDGSNPTSESLVYDKPISLTNTIPNNDTRYPRATTIRAVSIDENDRQSDVVTNTYIIGENVHDYFSFPVVSISTDSDNLNNSEYGLFAGENYVHRGREWERPVFVELFEPNGVRSLNQNLGLRMHGGFSRGMPQKSLRLYARGSYDKKSSMNYPFFEDLTAKDSGLPIDEFQRIILRNSGNDSDSTMFRDIFMQELVDDLGTQATQASRPSIVFINGTYWGILNIRERQDEYYLASHFGVEPDKVTILNGPGAHFDKGNDEGTSHYHDMIDYILEHDLSDPLHYQKVEESIDIDNFIDYYSAQIYYANTDWPHNNIRFWRYNGENDSESEFKDGRWRWLLFDTDFGFTRYHANSDHKHDTIAWVLDEDLEAELPQHAGNFLFRQLMKNETFEHAFLRRFQNHVNTTFRRSRVRSTIDKYRQIYEGEMPMQLNRWDLYNRQIDFWHQEVNRLLEFALSRPYYINRHLNSHFDLEDRFDLKLYPPREQHGQVFIDELPVTYDENSSGEKQFWLGEYFEKLPVEISVKADNGYTFVGWEKEDGTIDPDKTLTVNQSVSLTPIFEADISSVALNYQQDIQRAKVFTIMITYVFSLTLSLIVIWSIKFFVKDSAHARINRIISLGVMLTAILLIPVLLNIWNSGISVLLEQLSISLLMFIVMLGAFIGALLPHHAKDLKTFDA